MKSAADIIGNRAARARLDGFLDASDLESETVLVSGSAGIGKTTMLRELATASRRQGRRVGWGVAGRWSGSRPMWPWEDALRQAGVPDEKLAALHLGSDARSAPDGPPSRRSIYGAVADHLADLASSHPITIVIEDLDRADPTCLDLFGYLAERSLPGALLIVGSTRAGSPATDHLRATRIDLAPWTAGDVAAAAEASGVDLSTEAIEAVHRRTGGNPLFVQRLLGQPDPVSDSVPQDVSALIQAQMRELPVTTLEAVVTIAVVGTASSTDLLAALLGPDALDRLQPAVVAGLVHVEAMSVGFDSAVVRDAAYQLIDQRDRSSQHLSVAEALERAGADPGRIAEHLAIAARGPSNHRAAALSRRAGQAAMAAGALPEAIRYFRQGLTARRASEDRTEELDLVLDLVRALSFARRLPDAEQLLLANVDLASALEDRQRVLAEYTRLRWREEPNATMLDSAELSRLAQDWFGETEVDELVVTREVAMVSAAEIEGITLKALEHADRAMVAARSSGSDQLRAEAHLARRRALMVHHNSLAERAVDALAAVELADRVGDGELAGRARRLACADALGAGDRASAVSIMTPMLASQSGALIEHLAIWRAQMAALEGRTVEALAILRSTRTELAAIGVHSLALEYVATSYAWDTGELGNTVHQYEPVLATVADPTLRAATALGALIDGKTDAAGRHLASAVERLLTVDINPLWLVAAGAAAEVAAGLDADCCGALAEALAPYAGQCVVPAAAAAPFHGAVDRPLGLLYLRLGDRDRALTHLRSSLSIDQAMRAGVWEARSHAALAVALELTGQHAEAAEHRQSAEQLRSALGMGDVLLLGDYGLVPSAGVIATDGNGRAGSDEGTPDEAVLRRVGTLWEVGIGGETDFISPVVGLEHLRRLVADAGRDWHVLDLADVPGGSARREGHAGAVIDDVARSAYRQRYADLSVELAEAERSADHGRSDAARLEIDQLEEQLLVAYGLGGRSRRLDDPTERTRINVQRSVQRAIGRIASVDPDLADHLRHRVTTGRFCRYNPDPGRPFSWQL